MATLTSKLTLSSTDLTSDVLSLTNTTTFTGSHTTGLTRTSIKSASKVMQISCVDGDLNSTTGAYQGQYLDITDNHGLKKRYVIVDGSTTTVGTGDVIAGGTDIGSGTPDGLGLTHLIGGVAVDTGDHVNVSQAMIMAALKAAIEHANGHNASITVAAITGSGGDGNQSLVLTNPTAGENALFHIDSANTTLTGLILTTPPTTSTGHGTNSIANHVVIAKKGAYADPAIIYIKNTAAYHDTDGIVFLYWNDSNANTFSSTVSSSSNFMEIRGGQFSYIPATANYDLIAYTSTAGTIVEFMVVGTEA
jgi:hypothetical protein